jgi:PTH1 family peptidyl-tRNA hydrolase
MEPITLIVGLGNPGSEYANTRHNAGFWFADALCDAYGGRFVGNRKLRAELADISVAGTTLRVLKPQTYMNLSGESVALALRYYRLDAESMLVAYDEIDFEPGKIRLKFDGGHAGHNGVRDVIRHVGRNFWRLRLGVGHPGERSRVKGHLLKRADGSDERIILESVARGIAAIPTLVRDGPHHAQQTLHTEDSSGD